MKSASLIMGLYRHGHLGKHVVADTLLCIVQDGKQSATTPPRLPYKILTAKQSLTISSTLSFWSDIGQVLDKCGVDVCIGA